MTEPTREEVVAALRRLVALGPHGHRAQPVLDKDRALIERGNDAEYNTEHHRSLRCWTCNGSADRRVNPMDPNDDKTWGDVYHEDFEAWLAAKQMLEVIDGALNPQGAAGHRDGSGEYPVPLICCRGSCGKEVTDIDVLEGHEYPHCREHHNGFRDAIDKLVQGHERLRAT